MCMHIGSVFSCILCARHVCRRKCPTFTFQLHSISELQQLWFLVGKMKELRCTCPPEWNASNSKNMQQLVAVLGSSLECCSGRHLCSYFFFTTSHCSLIKINFELTFVTLIHLCRSASASVTLCAFSFLFWLATATTMLQHHFLRFPTFQSYLHKQFSYLY